MKYSPFSCFLFAGLLSALLFSPALSVAQNELVPAQGAVQLRRVWTQEGTHLAADEYGYNVWGGVDLTGDSIGDLGVYRKVDAHWLFYRGTTSSDLLPFWSVDSADYLAPVWGNFYGGEQKYLLLNRMRVPSVYNLVYVRNLYRINDTGLVLPAIQQFDPETRDPAYYLILSGTTAIDLDGNGADDYVMHITGNRRGFGAPLDKDPQVWIYLGGENFHLDTPSVIIRDVGPGGNNSPDNWDVRFADFDGDGRTDMVMGGSYPTGGPMLRFYWGDENSPWSWATRPPDRDLQLIHGQIGINSILGMGIYDLNGDGAADIGSYEYEEVSGSRIYLSGNGKNARTRSFSIDDADYYVRNGVISSVTSGYINDSSRRYEAVGFGGTRNGRSAALEVSGSSYGPDYDYEAWFSWELEGLLESPSRRIVAADVTGDGYDDQIHGNYQYGPFVNTGIVIVLAGGPEIPLDDTTLSVAEYPVAGESGGLYLWPNPVADELHIAWKGNLKRMPARFAVYDLQGQEVVSGAVEPYRGAALWRCGSVAAGTYTVVAYDAQGGTIAAARVVKR